MRRSLGLLVSICVVLATASGSAALAPGQHPTAPAEGGEAPPGGDDFEPAGLTFERNHGQFDRSIEFVSRLAGSTLLLTQSEALFLLRTAGEQSRSLRVSWPDANRHPEVRGAGLAGATSNYFRGTDRSGWQRGVPHYASVRYSSLYDGIDLRFYDASGQLEYDFDVSPGADPDQVRLAIDGADDVLVDSAGALVMRVGDTEVVHSAPVAYQQIGGAQVPVAAEFALVATEAGYEARFELGAYDPGYLLVVDPGVNFSTHLGGSGGDTGEDIARDPKTGNFYVVGTAESPNFPLAGQPAGDQDVFIACYDKRGRLIGAAYFGGTGDDLGLGIWFNPNVQIDSPTGRGRVTGAVYVTGFTDSSGYPTENPTQANLAGDFDALITVVSLDLQEILFSTFLGGTNLDFGDGIVTDDSGLAYMTGASESRNLKHVNGIQKRLKGVRSAIVAIVDPGLVDATRSGGQRVVSNIHFLDYWGGSKNHEGKKASQSGHGIDEIGGPQAIARLEGNYMVVTGATDAVDFPMEQPLQADNAGGFDKWMTVWDIGPLSRRKPDVLFSTYWGGSEDEFNFHLTLHDDGAACAAGTTASGDYPTLDPTQAALGGDVDGAVWCVDVSPLDTARGAIPVTLFSTFFGGSLFDGAYGIEWDPKDVLHAVGIVESTDLTTVKPLKKANSGFDDLFAARFTGVPTSAARVGRASPSIAFSTYYGGNGFDWAFGVTTDKTGASYVTGLTNSTTYPTKKADQKNMAGVFDAIVTKIKK